MKLTVAWCVVDLAGEADLLWEVWYISNIVCCLCLCCCDVCGSVTGGRLTRGFDKLLVDSQECRLCLLTALVQSNHLERTGQDTAVRVTLRHQYFTCTEWTFIDPYTQTIYI